MGLLEKWAMATLVLVALYLILTKDSGGRTFQALAGGYSDVLKTLQGR